MKSPAVGNTYMQERRGIAAIQAYAAHKGLIWRETGTGDVGIDGQLEFVSTNGMATGRTIAVQVKAGPSFFRQETQAGWNFYPEEKHRNYWEAFPLPVVLILHNPESQETYWTDVRQALRAPSRDDKAAIEVLRQCNLANTEPSRLFETAGVQSQNFIPDLRDVLRVLVDTRSSEASFPISYFDLFVHGLTNICRSIYYGMDLVDVAVSFNLHAESIDIGMGMGDVEHRFVFDFVRLLLAQNLAQIDFADCLTDWVDRHMQPHFVAPLTSRGRALVKLIHEEETNLVVSGKLNNEGHVHVAQEGFFGMQPISYISRLPRIKAFQEAY